ncbi:MAG: Holliday junction resolvase RuvX [Christensenellales bacterium]
MKRILALDVGDKRIGIAVSDGLGITAQSVESYTRVNEDNADAEYILKLFKSYDAGTLLIGMPRNMNGTYGPMADKVRVFGDIMEGLGCNVVYWDERLSTVQAERILIEADMSRKKRRKVIDKIAAATILQSYLDAKS